MRFRSFSSASVVGFALYAMLMYQSGGTPVARYHLENAWPAKVETSAAEASKNEVAIETLERVATPTQRDL